MLIRKGSVGILAAFVCSFIIVFIIQFADLTQLLTFSVTLGAYLLYINLITLLYVIPYLWIIDRYFHDKPELYFIFSVIGCTPAFLFTFIWDFESAWNIFLLLCTVVFICWWVERWIEWQLTQKWGIRLVNVTIMTVCILEIACWWIRYQQPIPFFSI